MSIIYQDEEDSYLFSKSLEEQIPKIKNYKIKRYLEIGAGSGIQLDALKKIGIKKANIFSCDINKNAVQQCIKKGFNCIKSDLFSNIKGKYNVIIFNPPYLPKDKKEEKESRLATTGGKKGGELINKFLKQAGKYLEKDGKIFLVTSSLTKGIKWEKWRKRRISEENLFFEKIYIWELKL